MHLNTKANGLYVKISLAINLFLILMIAKVLLGKSCNLPAILAALQPGISCYQDQVQNLNEWEESHFTSSGHQPNLIKNTLKKFGNFALK